MTQATPHIDNNVGFQTVKQRIIEMIDEIEQETDSSPNEDEKIKYISEIAGMKNKEIADYIDESAACYRNVSMVVGCQHRWMGRTIDSSGQRYSELQERATNAKTIPISPAIRAIV